jgi:hypothetical protein
MDREAADIYLIGHSHIVAMLDAVTNWRDKIDKEPTQDSRFGTVFQAWFTDAITPNSFQARIVDETLTMEVVEAWAISATTGIGALATIRKDSGKELQVLGNRKFLDILKTWNGLTPIVSMLRGNELSKMMLGNLPEYDFLDCEISQICKNSPLVDEVFIDALVDEKIFRVCDELLAIRTLVQNDLIHILPPPPREHPNSSVHFEALGDLISKHGFISDNLRLKWYRRYCRNMTRRLEAIGCHVLPAPTECCNSIGLLKEEFSEGLTHGNWRYGILVAKQLDRFLPTLENRQ